MGNADANGNDSDEGGKKLYQMDGAIGDEEGLKLKPKAKVKKRAKNRSAANGDATTMPELIS